MNIPYTKEINEPFAYGYLSALEKGKYLAMAEGLYQECAVMPIKYDKDVGLFECIRNAWGGESVNYGVGFRFCWGIYTNQGLMESKKRNFPEYAEFFEAAERILYPLYVDKLIEFSEYRKPDEIQLSIHHGFEGGTWGGHTQPDFGRIMNLTSVGIREKIRKHRKLHPYVSDFYDALERVLEGIELLGQRTKAEADKMAETASTEAEREHFLALSRSLAEFPHGKPYDFLSAAQFFWLYFSYDGFDSPGRLDQILIPYWRKTTTLVVLGF